MSKQSTYMPELFKFLEELADNNNRPWFQANKPRFDELRAHWIADIERLIALMGEWDPALRHLQARDCVYRIYRDTRFSLDKTPYKTYFSAAISQWGKQTHRGCYYIHLSPEGDAGLYGGMWAPDAQMLRKVRRAIVDNIDEFEEILSEPQLVKTYPDWYGERLKTIPKGYDRNHPQAEYLRLKEYGRFCRCPRSFFMQPDWIEQVSERFRIIRPLVDFLNYSLDEEV